MNPDPSRSNPDDAPTAAGPTTTLEADTDSAGPAPGFDLIESIAMEAVTVVASPGPSSADENAPLDSGPIASGDTDPMVGRRIGPYELTARIGGGSMGVVYRATRVEDFRQEVAVKLIERGRDGAAIVRRFHNEIHVQTAMGKHPNVAGLLDAGTTEDGRPYVVMEYVDGQPIDAYCDGRRLDISARLSLFGRVCGAVHFAHQHAVIHRDLKPSQILVTSDGVPKVLELGIARLIHPERGEPVSNLEYASPEQVEGGPITTAIDVYALGVLLYQLLTGLQPYRLEEPTTSELLRAICEQVPERPSMAVARRSDSPAPTAPRPEEIARVGLKRMLAGDLDAIVLMAMRKEPESRYASAEQFADDINCYIAGRPVRARRDSAAYRASKFVRRHAAAVAAGTVLLLAMVAGLAVTTRGLVLVRRDRDRAEASARLARRAVDRFFARVNEDRLLDLPGLDPLRETLLKDALRFYEEFLDQHGGDAAPSAELASAHARAAKALGELGSPAQAVPQLQRAATLWKSLVEAQPGNPDYPEEQARTLNDLGAMLMRLEGRRDQALRTFRRAQSLLVPLIAAEPSSASRRRELSLVLQNIGQMELDQKRPEDAVETLENVLEIEARLAAEDRKALEPRISMAKSQSLLGRALASLTDGTELAVEACQKAVELREAVVRERPELAGQTYLLAMDLVDLSIVQQMAGKLDSALKSLHRVEEVLDRLGRQYPGVLNYQDELANTYNRLSELYRRRSEPAESLAFAEKARVMLDRLVAEHPKDIHTRVDLAKAHNNIGRLHQQSGDPGEALRSFQRAVDLYESLPALDPRDSYNQASNVALCVRLIGAANGTQGTLNADKLSKGDRFRREKYGDRAVELLRRAARGGFLNLEVIESDTDLDAIRDRTDFQDLVKQVEKQSTESPR